MRYVVRSSAGASIAVHGSRICADEGGQDLTLELDAGSPCPGLINAHDHLHRNHYPRLGSPPYPDAYAWGADLHDRFIEEIERLRALDREDALLFGALKNLLGGATTVVHHDRWEPLFDGDFPIRVPRIRLAHSPRLEPDVASIVQDPTPGPFSIHLAEGVTPAMADEIRELAALGGLDDRLLAVHVVGPDDDGVTRLAGAGAAVVWCPTSNLFLFGRTAPPELLAAVEVLLGSDSLLTGTGTLLDELAAACRLSYLDDQRLLDAVGRTAARRLGLPPPSLSPGAPADFVWLLRPPLEASANDVALVVVDGRPRLGLEATAPLFELAGVDAERIEYGGIVRWVEARLARAAARVLNLSPECGRIFGAGVRAAG